MTLKEILKSMNITQTAFAEALNISPTNFSRYNELEKRSLSEIEKIATILNFSLSELIHLIHEESTNDYPSQEEDKGDITGDAPQPEYKGPKTEKEKQKGKNLGEQDKMLVIKDLSKAVAAYAETGKISSQSIQELIEIIKKLESGKEKND